MKNESRRSPVHDFWENGGYERRQEGKKIVAYCLICKRTLANAAKSKLQTHRNMCRNETDSNTPQNPQSAGKSISTDTDNNGNVIETTELESIQSESIAVDAITSLSDKGLSNVIALGVENAPEVPILLSGFDMPTVSHQEFSSAVSTT
ncbi:isoform b, partial [Lasius niger]